MSDPTFTNYSPSEATQYATHRTSYSPALYDLILKHHAQANGSFNLLLDVGCGPGNATRDLATHFEDAVGADPGPAMIGAAEAGSCKSGRDIRFVVQGAESLSEIDGLRGDDGLGKVDLLSAAMSVSFPRF